MKILPRLLCISIMFLDAGVAFAKEPAVRFNISRPYCVLNFLETAKGVYGTSGALREYIASSTQSDSVFSKLVNDYTRLDLDILYQHSGFSETRPAFRSIKDLLIIEAAQSKNIDEFAQRIPGILHSEDYRSFIGILKKADVFYERIIWTKYGNQALRQLKQFETFSGKASAAFVKLKKFYDSQWPDDVPFIISLTPVPGQVDETAATPHANVLCLDILVEKPNYEVRIAIALHEISHVLFAEESRRLQSDLEETFASNPSPFALVARNFFDEGLATANGNGWTYNFIAGKIDTGDWYNNQYIDGFGHVLFPLVTKYLADGSSIDKAFVNDAIELFEGRFPKALDDYGILFNRLVLHSNAEDAVARNTVRQSLYQNFSVYYLNFTSPILSPGSAGLLHDSKETQLIIVDGDHERTMNLLAEALPGLKRISYNLGEDFMINYRDNHGRLIMIAKVGVGGTDKFFKFIKENQYFDRNKEYIRL